MRNLNFNGESASEPYTPTSQNLSGVTVSDGFYSPDFRGDFGAGLLDLHAMDDTELLSEVQFTIWWFPVHSVKQANCSLIPFLHICKDNMSYV